MIWPILADGTQPSTEAERLHGERVKKTRQKESVRVDRCKLISLVNPEAPSEVGRYQNACERVRIS